MNQPWIYMCSPSRSPLPPPSPSHPSGSSQCCSPEHLSHASNLGSWSVSPLTVYLFQCSSHHLLLKEVEMRLFLEVAFWHLMMLNTSSYMLDHIIETMGQECQWILESQMAPEEVNLELIITEWPVKQEKKHIPQWGYRGKCHFLKLVMGCSILNYC